MENIEILKIQKKAIEKDLKEANIKTFVKDLIEFGEERGCDPYYKHNIETSLQEAFNKNIFEEYNKYIAFLYDELEKVEKEINKLEKENKENKELEEIIAEENYRKELQEKQEIAVIRFIIANMEKLVRGKSIPLTDVIEDPMGHPHYQSRVITELEYNWEKELLVHDEGRSGSPSAWNHYRNDNDKAEYQIPIFQLARWIVDDINAAKALSEEDNCKVSYMEIEGM